MAKVNPFKGIRYNPRAIPDLIEALAPPYDVISPEMQDELYESHDKNVVRLILGKTYETDTDSSNRYTRAAKYLDGWLDTNDLIREEKPAIYLYAQDYELKGAKLRRVGFMCRRSIEPFGESVFRHERTLSGPKVDRLNLTRACKMNFSPVFGLYTDPEHVLDKMWEVIMSEPPEIKVVDNAGVTHTMWIISESEVIEKVSGFMESKKIVIADGHHRYETALNYRNEMRAKENREGEAEYDYLLMYLSNTDSQGVDVWPTHRILSDVDFISLDVLKDKLKKSFEVCEYSTDITPLSSILEDLEKAGENGASFGLYAGDQRLFLLTKRVPRRSPDDSDREDEEKKPGEQEQDALSMLDVSLLQDVIFEKIFGVTKEDVANKKHVTYTVDAKEAIKSVDDGLARFAFLLNAASVDDVMKIALGGGVMPQKSTYFYPKLISGLVFNPLS
ncbi:hypothetical protein MNBD_NITROSPINAE02-610 [hydrothermal vent metagenome]|uniref:HTH domain of SpoOJ/ParA/ParB/repB family, involved in chromosome partitioning n=1 Tax=hydrothermal vent metagenome TaxID=652676 RepID=A0A3B1CR75_9ZZZZ